MDRSTITGPKEVNGTLNNVMSKKTSISTWSWHYIIQTTDLLTVTDRTATEIRFIYDEDTRKTLTTSLTDSTGDKHQKRCLCEEKHSKSSETTHLINSTHNHTYTPLNTTHNNIDITSYCAIACLLVLILQTNQITNFNRLQITVKRT